MSLKSRTLKYIENHGEVAKGDMQRLVAEKTSYTPENVGRRLRELENEGKLKVRYIKGYAFYSPVPRESYLNERLWELLQ